MVAERGESVPEKEREKCNRERGESAAPEKEREKEKEKEKTTTQHNVQRRRNTNPLHPLPRHSRPLRLLTLPLPPVQQHVFLHLAIIVSISGRAEKNRASLYAGAGRAGRADVSAIGSEGDYVGFAAESGECAGDGGEDYGRKGVGCGTFFSSSSLLLVSRVVRRIALCCICGGVRDTIGSDHVATHRGRSRQATILFWLNTRRAQSRCASSLPEHA